MKKVVNKLETVIAIFFALFTTTILYYAVFGIKIDFSVSHTLNNGILLVAAGMIFAVLMSLNKLIKQVRETKLWIIELSLGIAMVIMSCVILNNFRVIPITDAYAMLDQSKYLSENSGAVINQTSPYIRYFTYYENNYFLTLIFTGWFKVMKQLGIEDPYLPLYVVNSLCLLTGSLFAYLSTKIMLRRRTVTVITFMLAINPITYILIPWIYSLSFSIPVMMFIIYAYIRAHKNKNAVLTYFWLFMGSSASAIAYLIRPTSMFPSIAFFIVAAFHLLRGRIVVKEAIKCLLICISVFVLVIITAKSVVNKTIPQEVRSGNFPPTHWIMMGSHDEGMFDFEDVKYTAALETYNKKVDGNVNVIKANYTNLGLTGTFNLYLKKMATTFADGRSEYSVRMAQDTWFTRLYQFLIGKHTMLFAIYCQSYRILCLLGMIITAINTIKRHNTFVLGLILTMIGGYVFYWIWEAKPIYGSQYMVIISILGAAGLQSLADNAEEKISATDMKKRVIYGSAIIIMALLACVSLSYDFINSEVVKKDYSIYSYSDEMCSSFNDMNVGKGEVSQTFKTDKPFNTIQIRSDRQGSGSVSIYRLLLIEENDVIYETTFTSDDIRESKYTVSLSKAINTEKDSSKYRLDIRTDQIGEAGVCFYHRNSLTLDNYEGSLSINGRQTNYDLFMSVYNEGTEKYMSLKHTIIVNTILIIMIAISIGLIIMGNNEITKK